MQRFVVGTGRCGSTLLSRMLRCNPAVLEISEFYSGLDWKKRFQAEPMSGPEFWEVIATPHPLIGGVLQRGYRPPEITYPIERSAAFASCPGSVPLVLGATLPPLFADADRAYEQMCEFVRQLTPGPPADLAQRLFEWIAGRTGRSVWIERSGGAITWMGDLAAAFPDARFLHLHRAGEEAALSMREHPVFRLAVMLTYQIPVGEAVGVEALGELGRDTDHVARLLASTPPLKPFGEFWTDQIVEGCRALRRLDADQYHEVRYEDLVANPEAVLAEIASFLDLPDPVGPWRTRAAQLAAGVPVARFATLEGTDQDALALACRIGNRLLGRV